MCALALPSLWGHCYDLLSLLTQPLMMQWNENQRSRQVTNPCQLISIKRYIGSGLRVCAAAAIGTWKPMWIRTLDLSGKMQSFIAIQPFLFRSWEMTIWTSSVLFFQNLLISMPLGWWKHGDPDFFPYLSHIYPVLNQYFEKIGRTPS